MAALMALVCALAGWPVSAQAPDRGAPVHTADGSFVREWLVLGPFPSREMETDFLADAGGQARIRPKEGDTVTRSDGTRLTWTRLRSDYDLVNLEKVFGIQPWSVAYAYCELSSDRATETDLRPPASPSILWLNGSKIEPTPVPPGSSSDVSRTLPIHLKAGPNPCLLKLRVEGGDWVFSMQPLPPERVSVELLVTDAEGRPAPGAVIELYDQGEPMWSLRTGADGLTQACLYPLAKAYDVRATSGETGAWLYDVALRPGERRRLTLGLAQAASISGRVLAMDHSPQNAIVVQALRDPDPGRADPLVHAEIGVLPQRGSPSDGRFQSLLPLPPFSETVLSDTNGNFRFVNLRPGAYRLRCHGLDGFFYPVGHKGTNSPLPIIVEPGRTNEPIQFVFANAKRGVWRTFHITKGLRGLDLTRVHRTPDGMLWSGSTIATVHSSDGGEFKMFQAPQIPGGFVNCIRHDSEGAVWVGSETGVSRRVNDMFQSLPVADGLPRRTIYDILADPDGSVWFGTASGLCKYAGGNFSKWTVAEGLPINSVRSLARSRDGVLWIGSEMGLVKFDGGRFTVPLAVPRFNGMDAGCLHQARNGALWFGAVHSYHSPGVYRFDGGAARRLGLREGLPSDQVFRVAETSDGDLWFATLKGLSRFNGTTLVNYTKGDGLVHERIRDIFVDEDDVLWLATNSDVTRFDPNGFHGFTKQDGFRNGIGDTPAVFALEPDDEGGLWIMTEWAGIYRIDHQGRRPTVTPAGLQYSYVRQIHRDNKGTLWFGARDGIHKQVDGAMNRVLGRNWVIALTSDDQGRLWFGNGWYGGGASRFDPSTGVESVFTRNHGLPDENVWSLERSPGHGVWVGTGAGLVRVDGEKVEDEGKRLGIPATSIHHLRRDASGTLWISTARGLYYWDGTNTISITATNGLPDDHVWCSAKTPDGIIWMGSDSDGLIGYDGKAMTALDKRDGLAGDNVFALASAASDSLWVGFLDGGLTRYRRTKSRPSVRLLEVKLGDQTVTNLASVPKVEIRRPVSIQYHGIDLKTLPEKRQFYYRLANASGQIVFAGVTKDRKFEWTPQKGGAYTFEVQAIDRDLNYSTPARLAFRATVPWYANAWIIVPGGSTFGGLAIWAFIARAIYMRQRREAERLREQMLLQERLAHEALEEKSIQLEKAKEAADTANQAKSTFLANMSHEIRTPLNAVLGYAQILQQDRSLGTDQRQSAATIERSGSHLLSLINEILDLSKIEAGKMELSEKDFDLRELIRSLSEMFELRCRQKGLEWRVEWGLAAENAESAELTTQESRPQFTTDHTDSTDDGKTGNSSDPCPSVTSVVNPSDPSLRSLRSLRLTSDPPLRVRGDEVKLRQALINLLGNAVKFTDAGRVTLRVQTHVVPPSGGIAGTHLLPAPAAGEMIERTDVAPAEAGTTCFTFSVIDTGQGIPAEVREKIFEPFTQGEQGRQHGGTGLGLAIARRQIELMGGELRLDSEPGRGSRFFFSLSFAPASTREHESAAVLSKPARRMRTGPRVRALVADDVAENRDILRRVLGALGVEVTVVEDGEQALQELGKDRSADDLVRAPYDIAFLDIRMPGMTGYQVVQRILAEGGPNRARLVAVSASVLKHEQESYADAGFDGFVPKPYRFEQIRECLEKHLGVTFEDVDAASETKQADRLVRPTDVADAGADLDPGLAARYPLRILLADDYPENRELGARILLVFGYSCERAGNGLEVIAALEQQRFDLVFLDVHMPELDGLEAARRIRERWSDSERPWLVAMTASVERGDRETCLEAGMDDYVPKPVEIARIRRVLEEAGRRRASENLGPRLDESPIAWARLELMLGQEDAVLREFLEKHCRRTAERIDAMRAAFEAGNASELEILAHGCQGTSANFGIRALVRPAQELENAARSGDLSNGARLIEELQQAFAQVQSALQERFQPRQ
ncbi:MAG: response regulator [Verrucomicrobia bacterium]|nr:response regulator [Verrucomicrobiota bacterium]